MTFSIVAHCPRTGQVGVGALTAAGGVGKIACHARSGAGAISSQASMNPDHAYDTGARTLEWSGDRTGEGYAVQGNRLVGPETLEAAAAAF